jgi:hypothetical protein
MGVTIVGAAPQSQRINNAQSATSPPVPPPQSEGAVSTGGAYAPVLDEEKRPITAGGFVDSGPVVFEDVAEKAGLTRWRHVMGTEQKKFILETVGSGVALLDYDNDGWPDLYVSKFGGNRLYHNNHDGTPT